MTKKECKKVKEHKVFVRSVYRLGDYCDHEKDFGDSLTDPSQDEPIEKLVARMLRGEMVGGGTPQFDVPAGAKPAEVFEAQSVVERDGFDMADIPAVMAAGAAAVEALKAGEATPPTPEPEKAPEAAPEPPAEAPKA